MDVNDKYEYSFCVWPTEQHGWSKHLYEYFSAAQQRVCMVFTPGEFKMFAGTLAAEGFSLREVERAPYHDPEPVMDVPL